MKPMINFAQSKNQKSQPASNDYIFLEKEDLILHMIDYIRGGEKREEIERVIYGMRINQLRACFRKFKEVAGNMRCDYIDPIRALIFLNEYKNKNFSK